MLIELLRTQTLVEGEDDSVTTVDHMVAINPAHVSTVFESLTHAGPQVIVRMAGGRGFKVCGTYSEVVEKIRSAGGDVANALEGQAS